MDSVTTADQTDWSLFGTDNSSPESTAADNLSTANGTATGLSGFLGTLQQATQIGVNTYNEVNKPPTNPARTPVARPGATSGTLAMVMNFFTQPLVIIGTLIVVALLGAVLVVPRLLGRRN